MGGPKVAEDDAVLKVEGAPAQQQAAEHERRRTASWQDAAYHSVTAMVGAGVLGLPSAFVPLGWAGGIILLVLSFFISWYTYALLVKMHERPGSGAGGSPDGGVELEAGKDAHGWLRFDRYQDLTKHVWGPRLGKWALVPFQTAVLVGLAVTYTVVGGDDLHAIAADYHNPNSGARLPPPWAFYFFFGAAQLLLSQLPDFTALGWVSAAGAAMSVGYCTIATALSIDWSVHRPTRLPPPDYTPPLASMAPHDRVFSVFAAISTFLFAYGGHNISLEIQATLPNPPTVKRMMRGVHVAFVLTGILYFGVSITGFAALGNQAGGNIILALSNGPKWLRNLARAMVVVHVLAAFQVYTHPVFDWIESSVGRTPGLGSLFYYGSLPSRLALRTLYVLLVTAVAAVIPFFTDLMALVGAIAVTPTTFLLPPLLWLYVRKPRRFGLEWTLNAGLVLVTGVIGVIGAISAVAMIAQHAADYRLFQAL